MQYYKTKKSSYMNDASTILCMEKEKISWYFYQGTLYTMIYMQKEVSWKVIRKTQQENKYKCSNGKQKRKKEKKRQMEENVTFWSSDLQWCLRFEKLEFKARTIEISIN